MLRKALTGRSRSTARLIGCGKNKLKYAAVKLCC